MNRRWPTFTRGGRPDRLRQRDTIIRMMCGVVQMIDGRLVIATNARINQLVDCRERSNHGRMRSTSRLKDAAASSTLGSSLAVEGTAIQLPPATVAETGRRAVIVYRNALLRDFLSLALTDGGVVVVGAIPVAELEDSPLAVLNPDVIVFEDATAEFVRAACQAIVFGPASQGGKKLIVVGRERLITIVYQKEIVEDASLEDLVCRIRDTRSFCGG